jgi:FkbM family methyltransferase
MTSNRPFAMKLENPWIHTGCEAHGVAPNKLPTYLSEQYGQLAEDLLLEGILKSYFVQQGLALADVRYLEIGANHPIQTSNTYLFRRKWGGHGVLVEANPSLVDDLRAVRPEDAVLHAAIVPPGFGADVEIHIAENAELSSLDPAHIRSFGAIGQTQRTVRVAALTLDQLLDALPDGELHLMSIDIEGLDLEVLRESALRRRPVFVITEPSRHFHADADAAFSAVMTAQGYVEVARTDYNLIYGDTARLAYAAPAAQPPVAAPRQVIRSFDIFDTLIARRCIHPHRVFAELEQRSSLAGLAQARVDAEALVHARGEYGLEDIYEQLCATFTLEPAQAMAVLQMELQIELDNVVPIAENIARLDADAVLLTDMYLPEPAIRLLLRRAGIDDDLCIVRTSAGKASGALWRDFAGQGIQCIHLGDNARSDIEQARAAGMRATLCQRHQTTEFEQKLYVEGLPQTAQAWRAARLAVRDHGLPAWMRRLQTELNLPALLLAAAELEAFARDGAFEQLWFASRDARLLQRMTQALIEARGGDGPSCGYWFTSRYARTSANPVYLDYCRELLDAPSALVDLCGTGASVARLFECLGRSDGPGRLFVAQHIAAPDYARSMSRLYGATVIEPPSPRHVFDTRDFIDNRSFEMLNYAPEGMVRGVVRAGGRPLPVRDPLDLDGEALERCRAQYAYACAFIGSLRTELSAAVLAELAAARPTLRAILAEQAALAVPALKQLAETFGSEHDGNEGFLRSELARSCGAARKPGAVTH